MMETFLYSVTLGRGEGKRSEREYKRVHVIAPTIEGAFKVVKEKFADWAIRGVDIETEDEVLFSD